MLYIQAALIIGSFTMMVFIGRSTPHIVRGTTRRGRGATGGHTIPIIGGLIPAGVGGMPRLIGGTITITAIFIIIGVDTITTILLLEDISVTAEYLL